MTRAAINLRPTRHIQTIRHGTNRQSDMAYGPQTSNTELYAPHRFGESYTDQVHLTALRFNERSDEKKRHLEEDRRRYVFGPVIHMGFTILQRSTISIDRRS